MLLLGWSDTDVTQFADSLSNIAFWLLSIVAGGQVRVGLDPQGARWTLGGSQA